MAVISCHCPFFTTKIFKDGMKSEEILAWGSNVNYSKYAELRLQSTLVTNRMIHPPGR